jgi:uncharacterized protein (TIGR03000 family)
MFRIAVWTLQIAATVALLVASANPTYAQRGRGSGGGGGSRGGVSAGTTHSGSYGGYRGGNYGGYRGGSYGGYRGGYYGGSGVYIGLGWPGYYGGYGGYGSRSYYGGYSYPYYSDNSYYADTPTVSGYYSPPALTTTNEATVNVHVPPDAQVWFDGSATSQRGEWRAFASPPLDAGQEFHYDVRARWTDANGQAVDQTRRVDVRAGQTTSVDFIRPRQ